MNVVMLISSSLLLFTVVIFLLIAYTPLRQLVPGYGKVSDNAAIIELTQQVDELTRLQEQYQQKQQALHRILNEDERSLDSSGMKKPGLRK